MTDFQKTDVNQIKGKNQLPEIAFDESGNTGADLLNLQQPVFTLVSTDIDVSEANRLLDIVRTPQTVEPKVTKLRKSESGRRRLTRFIRALCEQPQHFQSTIYHKRFMVVSKIVDLLVEPLANKDGIDLYEDGVCVALSNLHFYSLQAMLNGALANRLLRAFIKMVRERSSEAIIDFYNIADTAFQEARESYREFLAPILVSESIIHEIIIHYDNKTLDPAVPSFVQQCIEWSKKYSTGFNVLHDASKALYADQEFLSALMDTQSPLQEIEHGERTLVFPLRAETLQFVDSKGDPRVQVADMLASCMSVWANGIAGRSEDQKLSGTLQNSGIEELMSWPVWPTPDVDPDKLGTTGRSAELLDVMTEKLHRYRNR